jgi:hypothetical protein
MEVFELELPILRQSEVEAASMTLAQTEGNIHGMCFLLNRPDSREEVDILNSLQFIDA